ncbi:hypothetical protein BC941DRAFT_414058 [Chlamydoabsidia padenii]|nr:hypothetical protein BC941DRAFT_414058 [Chlamydoabsidia padenii]
MTLVHDIPHRCLTTKENDTTVQLKSHTSRVSSIRYEQHQVISIEKTNFNNNTMDTVEYIPSLTEYEER